MIDLTAPAPEDAEEERREMNHSDEERI